MTVMAVPLLPSSSVGACIIHLEGLFLGMHAFRVFMPPWVTGCFDSINWISSSLVILCLILSYHSSFPGTSVGMGQAFHSHLFWCVLGALFTVYSWWGLGMWGLIFFRSAPAVHFNQIAWDCWCESKPTVLFCFLWLLSVCCLLSSFMTPFSYIFMSVNPWFCCIKNLLCTVICPWVLYQFMWYKVERIFHHVRCSVLWSYYFHLSRCYLFRDMSLASLYRLVFLFFKFV